MDMDMSDARHLCQHAHAQPHAPAMQRYPSSGSSTEGGFYQAPAQMNMNVNGGGMNGVNGGMGGMGPRRSIDVDALAAGVQRFLPGAPVPSSSGPHPHSHSHPHPHPPSSSSRPSLHPSHPHHPHPHPHAHSHHGHPHPHQHAHPHPHSHQHPHMSLSSTPLSHSSSHPSLSSHSHSLAASSSSASTAYIALPHGLDPSTVDFRTFYPYNPSEVKHRKRTTRGQLKILEETFRRETKPNAGLRKSLAAQLEMTPRGVQVWFQNRRAKAKALAKKASAGGDKKPNVNLGNGKDKDTNGDSVKDVDADDTENVDADDGEDGEDIELDIDERLEEDESSGSGEKQAKAKKDAKSSEGSDGNDASASATTSPPSSSTNSSSPGQTPPRPLAVEIPQPPPVGVRVTPPTNAEDSKTDGSPKRLSPSGLGVSRMSWSSSSDGNGQQGQHPSSATLPPTRTTPTPNLPSMEDETLLSLRRPSLPTHLHSFQHSHSLASIHGGAPPNAFRMHPRAARGLGSFSGASSTGQQGVFPPLTNGFDPSQRRMSLDRLAHHPYAHLAAQANGVVFGARYRPGSALGGSGSGAGRLPIGPKAGLQQGAMHASPNLSQGLGLGLQTIGSGGNTPTHTPQPRRSELPQGTGDAPGMDTTEEIAPDRIVPQAQQQTSMHQNITRPELMHRASLPAQTGIQFRNPFDAIGTPNTSTGVDGAGANVSGHDDGSTNAMQGIQTSTSNLGLSRGPLSASAIPSSSSPSSSVPRQMPFGSSPFMASHHSLHGHPMPIPDSGTYTLSSQTSANPTMMRFPREGHSYVLSTRSYQPPLAGPLPNPDFQFGTGTGTGSSSSDNGSTGGSGDSAGGSPDDSSSGPGPGSGSGVGEEGLNAQLQRYTFPPPSESTEPSDVSNSAAATHEGQNDVYEMHDLSSSTHNIPPHAMYHPNPYSLSTRYNSVVSVADSEVSVASCYSAAPSEVGSYDVGLAAVHGHGQMHAHVQGFDERRPSCTGQMMDMFSNLDMHNGSNLSLPRQQRTAQQQMDGIPTQQTTQQDSPMSNAQTSSDGTVGMNYASPASSAMSGGSGDTPQQSQQQQGQGPVISQSSELAFALQPDNSHLHPNTTVADSAGDLSATQQQLQINNGNGPVNSTRPRPDSVDASSLATSHRSSSDMSSLMYPLSSASAASSSSSLGFHQPPLTLNMHHHNNATRIAASDLQFSKPQPQIDMDFLHNYDDVSETGHYSPISHPGATVFEFPPVVGSGTGSLGFVPGPYDTHGALGASHMGHSHSMPPPPPAQQHGQMMEHGNGSFVGQQGMYGGGNEEHQFAKLQHHQHSQESLAFGMHAVGQSTDSFGYYG